MEKRNQLVCAYTIKEDFHIFMKVAQEPLQSQITTHKVKRVILNEATITARLGNNKDFKKMKILNQYSKNSI